LGYYPKQKREVVPNQRHGRSYTYSYREKEKVIRYIINQQEHHKEESTNEECELICKENGIEPEYPSTC
ncbi:MAG: hypothetical protein LBS08_05650, partial [Candidatus Symbiothrix sp.]|jgi:hypothetical protein|nr:hypothetical protein [Candidatus Symbiothrix sp.]